MAKWKRTRLTEPGAERIDGYGDLHRIGHGGFSVVYRARHVALARDVAVKVLNVDFVDDDGRRRLSRETELGGRLAAHPNVVSVLDTGLTAGGRPYLAMEYYSRGSLKDRVLADGPVPPAEAAAVGAKIARALQAAHEAGILHRDIKPQNILISRYGEPALADFGTARLTAALDQSARADALTPLHAAPEVLAGHEPTAESDVYSLGSTLYHVLTGRAAFHRDDDTGVGPLLYRVLNDPLPPLDRSAVPDALADVVERAMERDPARRFASAAEFGEALERAVGEGAVGAVSAQLPAAEVENAVAIAGGESGEAESGEAVSGEALLAEAESGAVEPTEPNLVATPWSGGEETGFHLPPTAPPPAVSPLPEARPKPSKKSLKRGGLLKRAEPAAAVAPLKAAESAETAELPKPAEGSAPAEASKAAESPAPAEFPKPTEPPASAVPLKAAESAESADSPKPAEPAAAAEPAALAEPSKTAELQAPPTPPEAAESPESAEPPKPAEPAPAAEPSKTAEPTAAAEPPQPAEPPESAPLPKSEEPTIPVALTEAPKPAEPAKPAPSPITAPPPMPRGAKPRDTLELPSDHPAPSDPSAPTLDLTSPEGSRNRMLAVVGGSALAVAAVAVLVATLLSGSDKHQATASVAGPVGATTAQQSSTAAGPLGTSSSNQPSSTAPAKGAPASSKASSSAVSTPQQSSAPVDGGPVTVTVGGGNPTGPAPHGSTAAPTSAHNPGAGPSTRPSSVAGPTTAPPPPPPQPQSWVVTEGPGCGPNPVQYNGDWYSLSGSGSHGCGDGKTRKQTGNKASADWIFSPGPGKSCTFTIYIPDNNTITSKSAKYQVYDSASSHTTLLKKQYMSQADRLGGSMTLDSVATSTTGVYDVQLYDDTDPGTIEFAGVITATCS